MADQIDTDADVNLLAEAAAAVIRQLAQRLLAVGAITLDDIEVVLPSFAQADA